MSSLFKNSLKRQPSISTVVPLYNHGQYIDAALDSILSQTVQPIEIIVVDDGSQDDSFAKVCKRAKIDPRIITWSHTNQGAHYTINAALQRASGQYVSILNSDDCYHDYRFEKCISVLEKDPDVGVVCSEIEFIDGQNKPQRNMWYENAFSFFKKVEDLSLALINGNFLMTTSNIFMRRDIIHKVGGFSDLRYAHDLDFFLRLIIQGHRIALLNQKLLKYRIHENNTIDEGTLKVKIEWAAVVAFYVWQLWEKDNWDYMSRLIDITERHNLTRLIFFFFKHFQRTKPGRLTVGAWKADEQFTKFMDRTVK